MLPIAKQTGKAALPPASKTALHVEDDPKASQAAAHILNKLGYAVTACSSGEHAVNAIRFNDFDLLLTDFELGGEVDGHAVIAEAKKFAPRTKTVLMSGKISPKDAALDDVNFVEKPIKQNTLVRALQQPMTDWQIAREFWKADIPLTDSNDSIAPHCRHWCSSQ